ncbi:MAG: UDP-2,4-diacetamido-2,4,6-trideoxy-beta-L-altropyranose hydrolase [Acidobacteriota bacterium]|nr:UDP-2,4-diacetamido-2,4,6-trideoxy-beta-L-altropyranose hydrolase [Acidobacteriota bacterium]
MLIFRTDASEKTGFGHLKRSVYLASLLKKKTEILFCVNNNKAVGRFLEERHTPYCWAKELENLQKTPTEIKSVVFDLREFSVQDIEFVRWAKANHIHTVQVTDLGLSQQPVDYIIDASIEKMFPYDEGVHVLDGPQYTLLHHKYRHFNKVERKYRKHIKNIFVSLGGGVEYRQLRNLVDILDRHRYHIKVAAGFTMKKAGRKSLTRLYPRLRFVGKTDSLARAFFEADAAIITAGTAAAEAAAVGTPALYLHYHGEQKFIAQIFEKHGAGLEIANIDDVSEEKLITVLNSLTWEKRIAMGNKGKQLVDGNGAVRIVEFFEEKRII